jgi:hypothetical protein
MIYFNFKLQLKFRNNKNYSSILVNFHTGTYINLKLKFMMSKNCHEKTPHLYTVTVLLLKPQKHSLISITSFRLSKLLYSWFILLKCTSNCCPVFINNLDHRTFKTKCLTHISFYILCLFYCFNFSSDAPNLPFIRDRSHVIMLPFSY